MSLVSRWFPINQSVLQSIELILSLVGGSLSVGDAARFALTSFSVGELLNEVGEKERKEVEKSLTIKYSKHLHNGIVEIPASVHVVTGNS